MPKLQSVRSIRHVVFLSARKTNVVADSFFFFIFCSLCTYVLYRIHHIDMDGTCASQGCVPNKENKCNNLWDWFYVSEQQIVRSLIGAALCGAPSGSSLFARVGN